MVEGSVEDLRSVSMQVSNHLALLDLRLVNIVGNLIFPSPKRPLDLEASVLVDLTRFSEFVTYDIKYMLSVKDRDDSSVMDTEITLNLLFKVKDEVNPTESDLRAFGSVGALDIAHPYMRETVQSLTARMGLPPLVLEIRAPEPINV
ncbi:hypothetical protein AB0M79_33960 [Polymorphospora sp. NPDC051019]|uniref:hypothetical protein n=1 Tax=Polymorphospora sp. NPDC051019 TaxID=3155725 RepID=UPI00343EBF5A